MSAPSTELDVLGSIFIDLGEEAARNTRAQLRLYTPWEGVKQAFSPEAIPRNEEGPLPEPKPLDSLNNVRKSASPDISKQASPGEKFLRNFGAWAARGLRAEGHSNRNVGRLVTGVRRLGRATRKMGALGGMYDDFATAGAFSFVDGLEVRRTEYRLENHSRLRGCVDLILYIQKVRPFYIDVSEFLVAYAMSLDGMPEAENSRFAIGFAFDSNGIPMTRRTMDYLDL